MYSFNFSCIFSFNDSYAYVTQVRQLGAKAASGWFPPKFYSNLFSVFSSVCRAATQGTVIALVFWLELTGVFL